MSIHYVVCTVNLMGHDSYKCDTVHVISSLNIVNNNDNDDDDDDDDDDKNPPP